MYDAHLQFIHSTNMPEQRCIDPKTHAELKHQTLVHSTKNQQDQYLHSESDKNNKKKRMHNAHILFHGRYLRVCPR